MRCNSSYVHDSGRNRFIARGTIDTDDPLTSDDGGEFYGSSSQLIAKRGGRIMPAARDASSER